ncbi:MAG: MEDS domain-containing protein, partial [Candidatus Hadarchaeum sp.]|uniref:MEDS domain-containing protein n=1 Tax=Candidatus Hadarchaeum sp. TaxID=2883567 RepID=UPI003D11B371
MREILNHPRKSEIVAPVKKSGGGKRSRRTPKAAEVIPEQPSSTGFEKIAFGEHLCGFYRDKDEEYSIIAPFFRGGLQNNEKCIWILDESTREEAVQALQRAGIDLEKPLASKQFELLSSDETYLQGGYFDPDRMIAVLKQTEERAIREGYRGLRISGEMTWALKKNPGAEKLVEYEAKLNYFFPNSKTAAICLYNEKKFPPDILLNIIYTHPRIIIAGYIYENCTYIPPDEFLAMLSGRITKRLVEKAKNNIIRLAEQERKQRLAEEELKISEERYRMLVETMNDGLGVVDENGVTTYVNDQLCRMLGYSKEEMIGRPATDFIAPEHLKIFEENLAQGKKGERRTYEIIRIRKDGEKIWTRTSAAPIFD